MLKVLFIGNSHTYYNDMVNTFARTCHANGIEVHTTMLTSPGKSLLWHSQEPQLRFNILYGSYDYIVLQDAAHPFAGEESLLKGVEKIKEFIDKTSSKTVLYMTWAEKRFPQNQTVMSEAYHSVAKKTNSILAPVGEHWNEVLKNIPQIELFDNDGEHASPFGSFLVSKIIYSTIFGELPKNIDSKIQNNFGEDLKLYLANIQ